MTMNPTTLLTATEKDEASETRTSTEFVRPEEEWSRPSRLLANRAFPNCREFGSRGLRVGFGARNCGSSGFGSPPEMMKEFEV